jgi:tetratricopeptide (TPR) repeat protein
MKCYRTLFISFFLIPLFYTLPVSAQFKNSREPALIRDTDVADGKDTTEAPVPKARDPKLAKQNITIGNFYLKKGNFAAAIQRYLEALEYQSDSIQAFEALARAYEKNGEIAKAISTYKSCIEKNPDLPDTHEIRLKLAKLEKQPS